MERSEGSALILETLLKPYPLIKSEEDLLLVPEAMMMGLMNVFSGEHLTRTTIRTISPNHLRNWRKTYLFWPDKHIVLESEGSSCFSIFSFV